MPPPFVYLDHLPDLASYGREAKDLQRQNNRLVDDLEQRGLNGVASALARQKVILENSMGGVGNASETELEILLTQAIENSSPDVQAALFDMTYTTMTAGIATAAQSVPYTLGMGVDWNLPNYQAEQFARSYSYELVTGINDTTKRGMQQALSRFILNGGTMDELTETIRPLFQDEIATRIIEGTFGVDRARMIAVTETTRAYAEGKIAGYSASGLAETPPEKKPPRDSHPSCRCDVRPTSDEDGAWYWVWLTSNDSFVCSICMPLHQKKVGIAKPAPPPFDPIATAEPTAERHQFERSVLTERVEYGRIYDTDGKLLKSMKGTSRRVAFSTDDIPLMHGRVVTHNHPGGASFSVADIKAAWVGRVAELRAVGMNSEGYRWTHSVRPNAAFQKMELEQIQELYESSYQRILQALQDAVNDGRYSYETANNNIWHNVWLEFERSLPKGAKLNYQRMPFDEADQ